MLAGHLLAVVLNGHEDFADLGQLEHFLLHHLEQRDADPEEHRDSLDEEKVPDCQFSLKLQVVHKETDQPLGEHQVTAEVVRVEVLLEPGQLLAEHLLEHFQVDQHAKQVAVVVQGQDGLHDLAQGPEGFLFRHHQQKSRSYAVPALAVANRGTSLHVGAEHIAKCSCKFLELFLIFLLRVGSVQVKLDLLQVRVWVVHSMLQHLLVVAWVVLKKIVCAAALEPNVSVLIRLRKLLLALFGL